MPHAVTFKPQKGGRWDYFSYILNQDVSSCLKIQMFCFLPFSFGSQRVNKLRRKRRNKINKVNKNIVGIVNEVVRERPTNESRVEANSFLTL